MPWTYLASGNYNDVYVNQDRTSVFKVQKTNLSRTSLLLDAPERSVRLWNQINSHIEPKAVVLGAYIEKDRLGQSGEYVGWSAPFIEGRDSTQNEIVNAQIDGFNSCGRCTLDALVPGNCKTLSNGQVVFVDIGMSLRLQKEDEKGIENLSFASNVVWEGAAKGSYLPWLSHNQSKPQYKDVVETTKALYTLQKLFPCYLNADFLRNPNPEYKKLKTALANELDNPGSFVKNEEAMSLLRTIHPISGKGELDKAAPEIVKSGDAAEAEQVLPVYQQFLQAKLSEYQASLPVDYEGEFSKPISVIIYKNKMMTEKIIASVDELLKALSETTSPEEAKTIMISTIVHLKTEIMTDMDPYKKNMNVQLQSFLLSCGQGITELADRANEEHAIRSMGSK